MGEEKEARLETVVRVVWFRLAPAVQRNVQVVRKRPILASRSRVMRTRPVVLAFWVGSLLVSPGALAEQAEKSSPRTAKVGFLIDVRLGGARPEHVKLTLLPIAQEAKEAVVLELAGGPGPLAAELLEGSTWEVRLEAPGFWAPPATFSVAKPARAETRVLPVWPTGHLTATVLLDPAPKEKPKSAEVTVIPPPGPASAVRIPKATLLCPLGEKGELRCELPAGALDLSLRVAGYVPDYRWGLSLHVAGELALGSVRLRGGASLAGWAIPTEGAIEAGKGKARLVPLAAQGGAVAEAERLQRAAAAESRLRDDGFFQLAGLKPGWYGLEILHPGFAPSRLHPVEVEEGGETILPEAIPIRRPVALNLEVTPPVGPDGLPWTALILRASDFSAGFEVSPVHAGPLGSDGRLQITGQAPGAFRLEIADSQGNLMASDNRWFVRDREDGERKIEIDLILLSGRVRLGDEPLAARLWFGGRHGVPQVTLQSGEDGEFRGILSRDGPWLVEIEAPEARIQTHAKVEVRPDRKGRAEVEIAVPDTLLFGKVVDDQGKPAGHADLLVGDEVDSLHLTAGEDGSFEFRALPPGLVLLSARRGSGEGLASSERVLVPVAEGSPTGPIELRLRRHKSLHGKVVSRLGPVAGAIVEAQAFDRRFPFGETARTRLDGSFSLTLPGEAESASVVVSAPGGALQGFEVRLSEAEVELPVSDVGGALEVRLPLREELLREKNLQVIVLQSQTQLGMNTLYRWARGHGNAFPATSTSFRVPRLAPGDYQACLGPRGRPGDDLAAWASAAVCASGFLPANGELVLEIAGEPERNPNTKHGSRP